MYQKLMVDSLFLEGCLKRCIMMESLLPDFLLVH